MHTSVRKVLIVVLVDGIPIVEHIVIVNRVEQVLQVIERYATDYIVLSIRFVGTFLRLHRKAQQSQTSDGEGCNDVFHIGQYFIRC